MDGYNVQRYLPGIPRLLAELVARRLIRDNFLRHAVPRIPHIFLPLWQRPSPLLAAAAGKEIYVDNGIPVLASALLPTAKPWRHVLQQDMQGHLSNRMSMGHIFLLTR